MIFYDANDSKIEFLKAVLDAKNVEYRTEKVDLNCGIGDKDLLLLDLFPAIRYLEERYPAPRLFSDSPEQNARLNLFVIDVLRKAYDTNDHISIFTELSNLPFPDTFLLGNNLTIADLILYPILPDAPLWNTYKAKIKEQLINIQ